MTWLKWLAVCVLLLPLMLVVLLLAGQARWRTATRELVQQLEAARKPPAVARVNAADWQALPPPVQRWFRAVLRDGAPVVSAVSIEHEGSFNMGESADSWRPFSSTQRVITNRPGFVWDGRVNMAPALNAQVHDAYVAGIGVLRPSLAGLYTLMELRGPGEVARGELMRWLAEAPWYPTALLPGQGVSWQAIDEHSAQASVTDGGITVSLRFIFGDDGLLASVFTPARERTVAGQLVATPWEGRWFDYAERSGMLVPMRGEVAWLLPEGRKPYWRGTVNRIDYEFAP
jgi:hypothetical protein